LGAAAAMVKLEEESANGREGRSKCEGDGVGRSSNVRMNLARTPLRHAWAFASGSRIKKVVLGLLSKARLGVCSVLFWYWVYNIKLF
jgi:hypothetical protein